MEDHAGSDKDGLADGHGHLSYTNQGELAGHSEESSSSGRRDRYCGRIDDDFECEQLVELRNRLEHGAQRIGREEDG